MKKPVVFDAADYLDSEEVIAEYLNVALASEHPDLFLHELVAHDALLRPLTVLPDMAAGRVCRASAIQRLTRGTDTGARDRIVAEVLGAKDHHRFLHRSRLVMQRIDQRFGTGISRFIRRENVLRPEGNELAELIPLLEPFVRRDRLLYETAVICFSASRG